MALLRQCLMELRAAQQLAQSRKSQEPVDAVSVFASALSRGATPPGLSHGLLMGEDRSSTRAPRTFQH